MSERLPASSMPTLRQLQFLTAIRAEGSFVAAAEAVGATAVHIAGGVSANRALRATMRARLELPVRVPPPALCTDNAAMIGAAAHFHFIRGRRDSLDFDVVPSLQLV